jgi:hypothetical protein
MLSIVVSNNNQQILSKNPKHPFLEKLTKQIQIILKIAKINGYDDNFRIKNENNQVIENSNIITLLQNVTTPSKVLIGQESFVNLLYKAGVEPDLISNENIKYRLINLYESKPIKRSEKIYKEPQIYSTSSPVQESLNAAPVIKSIKRQLDTDPVQNEVESEIEPPKKRKANWIIPSEDLPPLPEVDDNEL